ncbi:methyltransferase domain-containing protein [Algicella marina]|uniref:Methyltransferase domain-containing protein n=2 Tax=Algicella marina TaxID=2683284 RepID=A0A6P1T3Z3_9RHOB|nr:methyltransferase domain-containing protein [Algicella marina]
MSSGAEGSHGALMDAVYRRQRHIYDITRKYYLLGRDRLIRELAPPPGGLVLEVACGTGRNLIKVARTYPDCRLAGFDISAEMLETARANIARAGLSDRITVAEGDATNFQCASLFGRDADRIILSYCLSMIPDWEAALHSSIHQGEGRHSVHVVDFGAGSGLPGSFNRGLQAWLAKFHVSPRADLHEALESAAAKPGRSLDYTALYRDYAQYGVLRLS